MPRASAPWHRPSKEKEILRDREIDLSTMIPTLKTNDPRQPRQFHGHREFDPRGMAGCQFRRSGNRVRGMEGKMVGLRRRCGQGQVTPPGTIAGNREMVAGQ